MDENLWFSLIASPYFVLCYDDYRDANDIQANNKP